MAGIDVAATDKQLPTPVENSLERRRSPFGANNTALTNPTCSNHDWMPNALLAAAGKSAPPPRGTMRDYVSSSLGLGALGLPYLI